MLEHKRSFYTSIKLRGYDNICLLNANDTDVLDFIEHYPHGAKHIHTLRLKLINDMITFIKYAIKL